MTSYLVDTNVVSETRRPKPDPAVLSFLQSAASDSIFVSVLTLGELRKGIAARRLRDPDPAAANRLAAWVDGIEATFADRILAIDIHISRLWGVWSAERPRPVIDTLLAATAVQHDLTLATRNVGDFAGIPVPLFNPWRS